MTHPTPQRWARLEEVFLGAIDLPESDRDGFITQACADHPSLAADVRRLLADHERAADFIEPVATAPAPEPAISGRRLGAYTLVRVIASGGMGTVFEAVQDSPRRSVALKVLRAGLASPGMLRRFREESAILARLQHPAIAQIHEAGTTEDTGGPVPFFAMELVEGARPITAFAHQSQLTTGERLDLFLTVCDAVQHAHQKGVIHRDLKPGNILIDATGHPRVIDFGVARALGVRHGATVLTDAHTLVGTVAYMSPEQCDPSSDADVRTDVYSLGVVLYELLSGALPYTVDGVPLSEATRIIREQSPRRLSAILPTLRADLETICLKALEKDRNRRYQSVSELGADLRRFLAHQPISARPPTLAYQVRKFVARNRLASGAAGAALLAGLAFAVTVTVLYTRADAARQRAEAAEREALDQRNRSRAAGRELITMLQGLDPSLTAPNPDRPEEVTQAPLEILDRCAQSLGHMLGADPVMHADALLVLTGQYSRHYAHERAYNAAAEALALRRRELGPTHVSVADALMVLAPLADRISTPAESEDRSREAIAIYEANLPAQAASLARALEQLARFCGYHGDLDSRRHAMERAFAVTRDLYGASDPRTAELGLRLASGLVEAHPSGAEQAQADCLRALRSALGDDHPRTLRAEAGFLRARGDLDGSERATRRLVAQRREALGPEHPDFAAELVSLGGAMFSVGRVSDAVPPYLEALDIVRRAFGDRSLRVASVRAGLAFAHYALGETAEGEAHQRQALSINRAVLGDDHIDTAGHGLLLATPLALDPVPPHAAELLDYARAHYERTRRLGAGHPLRSGAPLLLGMAFLQQGRDAEAEPMLAEAVEIRRTTFTPNHPMTVYAEGLLAACRARLGRCDQGAAALAAAHENLVRVLGPRHLRSLELLSLEASVSDACGRADAARSAREEFKRLCNPGR